MKMIGFREENDKDLSKSLYLVKNQNINILNNKKKNLLLEYLKKSDRFLSKTFAVYDGDVYIGPYMIISDGEWIWPNYYPYYIEKEGLINSDFFFYLEKKNFEIIPLSEEQKKHITIFIERELLHI